jgi:methionine aminopeptidase
MSQGSIKTDSEINAMRRGGRMLAMILELMRQECMPGKTPKDMSSLAARKLQELGGEPAFLNYRGQWSSFPCRQF